MKVFQYLLSLLQSTLLLHFLQTYHLGSILFNKFDFIRCNGYPNNVFNQYGHDISLYSRLIENNIKISFLVLGIYKNSNGSFLFDNTF